MERMRSPSRRLVREREERRAETRIKDEGEGGIGEASGELEFFEGEERREGLRRKEEEEKEEKEEEEEEHVMGWIRLIVLGFVHARKNGRRVSIITNKESHSICSQKGR